MTANSSTDPLKDFEKAIQKYETGQTSAHIKSPVIDRLQQIADPGNLTLNGKRMIRAAMVGQEQREGDVDHVRKNLELREKLKKAWENKVKPESGISSPSEREIAKALAVEPVPATNNEPNDDGFTIDDVQPEKSPTAGSPQLTANSQPPLIQEEAPAEPTDILTDASPTIPEVLAAEIPLPVDDPIPAETSVLPPVEPEVKPAEELQTVEGQPTTDESTIAPETATTAPAVPPPAEEGSVAPVAPATAEDLKQPITDALNENNRITSDKLAKLTKLRTG